MKTIKGPAIFLAQFAGDAPPFNSLKSIAGWAYDFGKGRVVFTSVGHTIHALWAPEYVKLQKQAIQWLLKEI